MEVQYRHYEPNQGLEDQQAKIYTECANPGRAITGEEIQQRYEAEKIDPKTIRYVLSKEGQMLAYVQARDYPTLEETHIGYPWALPECPIEAQEKIFDELLAYIKQREETLPIRASAAIDQDKQIEFFRKKGFNEIERGFQYFVDFDVEEASKMEKDDENTAFSSRVATTSDLPLLLEIVKADSALRDALPGDEGWTSYFNDRVLKDGHAVLVFHDDQIVAASAPLRFPIGDAKNIIFRFQATRPGYAHAWTTLLIGIAKECLAAGWTDIPLRASFGFTTSSSMALLLAKLQPDLEAAGYRFGID